MAAIDHDQLLVASVLDRLLDDDPTNDREPVKARHQVLSELKQSVQRDLRNLLNTRRHCQTIPPELTELEVSLADYGIPDFTGAQFSQQRDRESFRRIVESVIERFEPRLFNVVVHLHDDSEEIERTIRFQIDAMLMAEPAPEPVVFETRLQPNRGEFEVETTI